MDVSVGEMMVYRVKDAEDGAAGKKGKEEEVCRCGEGEERKRWNPMEIHRRTQKKKK